MRYREFVEQNKDTIKEFCPPYDKKIVGALLWYWHMLGVKIDDLTHKQLMAVLTFAYEHIDDSHELFDLAEMIKFFINGGKSSKL